MNTAPPRFPGAAVALSALLATALARWIHVVPLEGTAHVKDEMAYLFQADNLARLSLSAPWTDFSTQPPFSIPTAQGLFGAMPNGWPAMLALAHTLGLPYGWLNPLLLGGLVLAGARLAARVVGPEAATPAAGLLALSPAMLLLGASSMNHTAVALCWVLAWLLALSPPTRSRGLGLGALVGLCFLTRPLCGAVLGGSLLLAAPRPLARWAWAVPTLVLALGLQMMQNRIITGAWSQFPINHGYAVAIPDRPGLNSLGFGPDRGMPDAPGHDLRKALHNTTTNLQSWVFLLLGPGGLLLAPLGLRHPAARGAVARWLASAAGLIVAYGLYWYVGTCYGARFYHGAAPLMILATTAGVLTIRHRSARLATWGALAIASLWSLGRALPELSGYWNVDGRFQQTVEAWDRGPAIVLVRDHRTTDAPPTPLTGVPGLRVFSPAPYARFSCVRPEQPVCFTALSAEDLAAARATGRSLFVYDLSDDPTQDRLAVLTDGPAR